MEVPPRFELGNKGFADLGLTTWRWHRIWSGKRDSNSRPPPWQGDALPTELFPHYEIGGDTQNRTEDRGFAVLGLTTWLCRRNNGAENEARTRDPHLGKVVLYH